MFQHSIGRFALRLWLPGVAVALVGCLTSYALWQQQQASVDAIAELRFEQETRPFADALQRQMESHTDLLQGLRGLFTIKPQLRRAEFERVASELNLVSNHPGVKNIHFTRYVPGAQRAAFQAQTRSDPHMDGSLPVDFAIHPEQERAEYFVIEFLWPQAGNAGVLGLEIHPQPSNLEAMGRARDGEVLVASAPFDLIQESEHRTGIMIRTPVFAAAAPGQQEEGRFLGSVGVSVRIYDVVQALRRVGHLQDLALTLSDIGLVGKTEAAPARRLFGMDTPTYGAMQRSQEIQVGGRRWLLEFRPTASLLSPQEQRLPWMRGLGGLLITALLTALVSLLVLRRASALEDVELSGMALRESEARFRAVFNQAAVGMAQVDLNTDRLMRTNQRFCDMLGYTEQELQQLRFQDITDPEDLSTGLALMERLHAGKLGDFRMEKRYRRKDGSVVWGDLMVSRMNLAHEPGFHLAVLQDISERKRMEQALRGSEQRLLSILNHMPVGVNLVQDRAIVFRNDSHVQICGYGAREAPDVDSWWRLAMPDAAQRLHTREAWRAACTAARDDANGAIRPLECVITSQSGQQRTVELSGVMLQDSHIVTMVDLSQRRQAEQEVNYLANNDPLTGLPNRRLLLDRLQQALAVSARHQQCGAVLMLDLDHFKQINETQGHDMGDRLLQDVAARLRRCIPEDDTLARHGGDEFVVVLKDLGANPQEAAAHAEAVGQQLLVAMREPFAIGGGELRHSTLSVGITIFQGLRESPDELLKRSDMAMYEAKAAGRNALRFFDPQMQAQMSERVALEKDMRTGLQAGHFELYYQPKMVRGRITGAEALVRWRHPVKGFIPPSEFIPLAEQCGLILRLGQWVLRAACERLALWNAHPVLGQLSVAVNVSPREFHEASFVPQVLEALAGTGADARRLRLELTEGLLLQDVEDTIAKMVQLRGYGVGFALDDFGTGYSSLAYLKRLPLHELKIDQSFVRDVLTDPNDAVIARTIVALGTSLGLQVVAEGVETEAQRSFLERSGCHAWQGYLLSRPLPVPAFEDLVLEHAPDEAPEKV
ncbi:EAL domain-containing protein [Alicycliphilus denitrificans]|uniref:bifunctional diguanylate cyclase/phosphodiesterase n=1 Tax=Alicycliphilus denitrificans TaxID=179636 RepID=UPI00384FDB26